MKAAATNGHSGGTLERLQRLLADHEGLAAKHGEIAASVRLTLSMLTGAAEVSTTAKGVNVLADALALDAKRSDKVLKRAYTKRKGKAAPRAATSDPLAGLSASDRHAATRAISAQFIAAIPPKRGATLVELAARGIDPTTLRRLGGLFAHGYLEKIGDRIHRTSKEYTAAKA